MTTQELHLMLDDLPDARAIVVRRLDEPDVPLAVWRAAAQDVQLAYASWCEAPGAARYAAYLAAMDQDDAAVASLRAERVLLPG